MSIPRPFPSNPFASYVIDRENILGKAVKICRTKEHKAHNQQRSCFGGNTSPALSFQKFGQRKRLHKM